MLTALVYLSLSWLAGVGLYTFTKPASISTYNELLLKLEKRERENDY